MTYHKLMSCGFFVIFYKNKLMLLFIFTKYPILIMVTKTTTSMEGKS